MPIDTIFFDLDGTLYNHDCGIWEAISDKMNEYMHRVLNISLDQVEELRERYFHLYGTTLKGLEIHHNVNSDEFLEYVHGIPVHQFIDPNPAMLKMLQGLEQRKFIFTNADRYHAGRVLNALGVADQFLGIVDVRTAGMSPKPDPASYEAALQTAGFPEPARCMMVDDLPKNLKTAKELSFTTVLVGGNNSDGFIDHHVEKIEDLGMVLENI